MNNLFLPDIYSADQNFTYSGLEGKTDYSNMLTLLSLPERFAFCIVLPVPGGTIRFPDYDGPVVACSDFYDFGPNRVLLPDAWHVLVDGTVEITGLDTAIYTFASKNGKTLLGVKKFFRPEWLDADFEKLRADKEKFLLAMKNFPEQKDELAAKTVARAWSVLRACVYSPEEKFTGYWVTPDRYPHRACWIMDSVYQALGLRFFDRRAAVEAIFALFAHQRPGGMIPMVACPERTQRAQIQQPVIAAGLKALNPTKEEIAAAYPHLKAFIDWVLVHRDCDDDGMLEWLHSGGNKFTPCGESGMDNSPRFDTRDTLIAVDLNSLVSRECEVLSEFAATLGKTEESGYYRQKHENLNTLIEEKLWSDKLEFYTDCEIFYGKQTGVMAVSGFMPLICGAASPEHAAKLAAHVRNPRTFGTYYPLPSVSLSDPGFASDMWRGPVWHIFNYHTAFGLDRYGFHDEARLIRERTVEAGIRYYREYGGFYEFYDGAGEIPPGRIDRKGPNRPDPLIALHRAVHDYGWSAAIFLDMLEKISSSK